MAAQEFTEMAEALTNDQKLLLDAELDRRREEAERQRLTEVRDVTAQKTAELQAAVRRIQADSEQSIAEAKMLFKASTYSCRKPEIYDASKSIKLYMDTWDHYRSIMRLRS